MHVVERVLDDVQADAFGAELFRAGEVVGVGSLLQGSKRPTASVMTPTSSSPGLLAA
jgi:hypothetical protein